VPFFLQPLQSLFYSLREVSMLELLKSLAVAIIMVPIVMAIMLGLIYGLGEVFNVISKFGRRDDRPANSSHH
jgi:hypothetical protein